MSEGEEITFVGQCEVCGRKQIPCRNHHMVPRRLLAIIPKNRARKFEFWKLRICDSCNKYFHVENKFWKKIQLLETIIKFKGIDIQKTIKELKEVEDGGSGDG
jgi:hypothetical protein